MICWVSTRDVVALVFVGSRSPAGQIHLGDSPQETVHFGQRYPATDLTPHEYPPTIHVSTRVRGALRWLAAYHTNLIKNFLLQNSIEMMRAVQFYDKEDVRVNDHVDIPVTREGTVRIKPAFVGICGTGMALTRFQYRGLTL